MLTTSEIVKEVATQKAKHSLASARPPDAAGLHNASYHLWCRAKEAASSDNCGNEWISIDQSLFSFLGHVSRNDFRRRCEYLRHTAG
jgi:hypothetical protein